ncbi:MAG TPA: hypothetical protein VKV73_06950 [Chloroflexota bacterium]|nr:hypothetical protein [Chloroflexota bacterium]
MVALESPSATRPSNPESGRGGAALQWNLAAGGVLLVGLGLRLALGGGGVGDRSALVMATLLAVGVWLAARLLTTPRTAFLIALGMVALLDLGALPARNALEYDYREAFFRTDQEFSAQVSVMPGQVAPAQPVLVLLVEPVFPAGAAQPSFGLAGDVDSTAMAWDCAFQRGLQHLALPVPPGSGSFAVRLHLTGSPTRETDYLLVYASAPRGGFLVSLVGAVDRPPDTTVCSVHQ